MKGGNRAMGGSDSGSVGGKEGVRRRALAHAGVAGVWLFLAVGIAARISATTDEIQYFGAGLSLLHFFDYRMVPEHPPLMRVISGLPIYLFDRPDMSMRPFDKAGISRRHSPWLLGMQGPYGSYLLFLSDSRPAVSRLMWGRVPVMLIGLLGALFVWRLGREVGRTWRAGSLAAFLLLFYPEYMGNACLMTLDTGMTTACAGLSLAGWMWWKRPGWSRGAWFAAAAGLASLVKVPVVVFTVFILMCLLALSFVSRGRVSPWRVLALGAATLAAGVLAAWAGAGFRFSYLPPGANVLYRNAQIPPLAAHGDAWLVEPINFLWRHRLLPETTLASLANFHKFADREYFYFGRVSTGGWYSYFLVTFLLKTPPTLLIALGGALVWGAVRWRRRRRSAARGLRLERAVIIGLPFLLLLSVTVASRVNQGHRYILFLYVPLSVWLGAIADRMLRAGRTLRWVAGILLAGYLASFALAYPHCLTYFNVLGGSPYKASAILGDTNTDWGQDILDLSVYLEKNGIEKVNMALFGLNLPDGYGIRNYNWIGLGDAPPLVPSERIVARPDPSLPTVLSVNNLVLARKAFPGMFDREPDADLNSIVVYLPAGRSDGDLP